MLPKFFNNIIEQKAVIWLLIFLKFIFQSNIKYQWYNLILLYIFLFSFYSPVNFYWPSLLSNLHIVNVYLYIHTIIPYSKSKVVIWWSWHIIYPCMSLVAHVPFIVINGFLLSWDWNRNFKHSAHIIPVGGSICQSFVCHYFCPQLSGFSLRLLSWTVRKTHRSMNIDIYEIEEQR